MKKYVYQALGVLAISVMVVSCNSTNKSDGKSDIGEPNNSILEAGLLESGKSYDMKIDTIGDVDWFAIPVSGQGYLDVSAKNIPDGMNLVIRFSEKEEWEQTKEKWITGELSLPATIPVYKPDTIYFMLKDKYHATASEEDIAFRAEFIEEFDSYEPNNEAENAQMVSTGEVVESAFFPTSDVDWFKTKVDSSGYLMIQARSIPDNIQVETRFAKRPDDFSDAAYISGGLNLPAAIQVTEPGEYYFYLKDRYNANMSRDMAEWKIDFITEIDTTEPNNSFNQAYRLAVNDTVKVAIFPQGDTDYFSLTPEFNSTLRIAAKYPKDLRPEIQLYKEEDFEQVPIGNWQELPLNIEVEANQKYYIRLHSRHDSNGSREPVLFSVSQISKKTSE